MSFAEFFTRKVTILDGGMGTTLQSEPFNVPLDSVLWSSELLATTEGRKQLRKLGTMFSNSGAELIGSCTYQSSLPLFLKSDPSYSEDHVYSTQDITAALAIMISAIEIVNLPYLPSESTQFQGEINSYLSLGPFGAQCSPGQEYSGNYPAPFGKSTTCKLSYSPAAYRVMQLETLLERVGVTGDSEEDHLAAFHLQRLEQFAASKHWDELLLIAFETIPLLVEVRAIRRAMGLFSKRKPFYLSFVFPADEQGSPKFPDSTQKDHDFETTISNIVATTFNHLAYESPINTPEAIGINCTNPDFLPKIINSFSSHLSLLNLPITPYLVLYPDGGAVYDVVTRSWSRTGLNNSEWSQKVINSIGIAFQGVDGKQVYGGVLAGGCCKTGPSAIKKLRTEVDRKGWGSSKNVE